MIQLNSDFRDLISLLDRYEVKYLVVGGYAVMLYAEPRYTKDLDIAIGVTADNVDRFAKALEEFGFPRAESAIAELTTPNRMISIGRAPSRIDILNEIEGVDFDVAWDRRNRVDVEGLTIEFISKEDLISAKRAAGRPQDLLDLKALGVDGPPSDR